MRAETQNNVDAITKSLALLAQRMDWDTAAHRLEEFDAMIEAPDLWNDPAKAQKLMRERQALLEAGADTPPGNEPADITDVYPASYFNKQYFWPGLKAHWRLRSNSSALHWPVPS